VYASFRAHPKRADRLVFLVGNPRAAFISADQQQKTGSVFTLRGNVEIRYRDLHFFADEIIYDEAAGIVAAQGNVAFEAGDDRIEASEGRYSLNTGVGEFRDVQGTVGVPPKPSSTNLVTENPYYFEAERVERRADNSYLIHKGWVTNCDRGSPKWRMKAARATIRPGKDVQIVRATFVLKGISIFVMPYWWLSADETPRKSGFLMPVFGDDSQRGPNLGGSYYQTLGPHADMTLGVRVFERGGWTQRGEFRARPTAGSRVQINYFGAEASNLSLQGVLQGVDVSGQTAQVQMENRWENGVRGVADINFLSSLRFRQRFAETFNDAVISEVRSDVFFTANPGTSSLNVFASRYQNFRSAIPESSVTILAVPGIEFSRRPSLLSAGKKVPVYYSLDAQVAGMRRTEPRFQTPELVQRLDVAPRVTLPLYLGYFTLTPTFGVRATRYGARFDGATQSSINLGLTRFTQEAEVELGFPSVGRIFRSSETWVKHAIEPQVTYRYRNGVRQFEEVLRFDERDLLTDTHEVEYSLTQRFFVRRSRDGQARELIRWTLRQKYFFDPTLRGALQNNKRNVVASLVTLTPFAFADGPRRFSPVISDFRVSGEHHEADFRVDFDTLKSRLIATRVRLGTKLTELVKVSATHFATRNNTLLQPRSNQFRLQTQIGSAFRRGFNGLAALSWNLENDFFQNLIGQVSYNWDCCGVAFEFRRLGLGAVRSENEYRFSFTLANVGTFGTVRREEPLY
jgi:LPS-assembly protein